MQVLRGRGREESGNCLILDGVGASSEDENLNQSNSEVEIDFNVQLFKLNLIINLKMFCDVFAAGIGVLLVVIFIFTVIHGHIHAAVQVFLAKSNF